MVQIIFHTDHLYKRSYIRAIKYFLYTTNGWERDSRWNDWKIDIYSSTEAPNDPHFDGQEGVGGVTGFQTIKLYVIDTDNGMVFLQNFMMISHELCHMMLIVDGRNDRVRLRNDDWSGNKKGTELNFSTAEVHDRHIEKKFRTMSMWGWYKIFWKRFRLRVIDITDLL